MFPLRSADGEWMPIARDTVVSIPDTSTIPFWVVFPLDQERCVSGSSVIVPLVIDGQATGSVSFSNRRTHAYPTTTYRSPR